MSDPHHSVQETASGSLDPPVTGQFYPAVDDFLAAVQTYQMEYDVYNPLGRLPSCFAREFGGELADYVILRDPNHNEFEVHVVRKPGGIFFADGWQVLKDAYDIRYGAWITLLYVGPTLLTMRVLTRWCFEINYPSYDPPLRHLLARSDSRCKIGSSVVNVCSSHASRPKVPVHSFEKILTHCDIHSDVLVLPWRGFGESAFAHVFTDLILVDNAGKQYKCDLKINVDSGRELACHVSGGWRDLCAAHAMFEGDRVKFTVDHGSASNVVYVSVYPQIRVEDYLNLDAFGN